MQPKSNCEKDELCFTFRSRKNCHHVALNIFKLFVLYKRSCIFGIVVTISLKSNNKPRPATFHCLKQCWPNLPTHVCIIPPRNNKLMRLGVAHSHVSAKYQIVFRWYFEPEIILSVMCMRFCSLALRLCWSISVCEWSACADPRHALVRWTSMIWAKKWFWR